jgi:CRISPR-associated protein Csm2
MPNNFNRPQGGGRDNRDYHGGPSQSQSSPPVKIESFYTADNRVKPDLFDTAAVNIAKSFVGKNDRGYAVGVSKTQLRRLFDEVKRFEQLIDISPDQWESQLPYIRMIKSKVSYAVARAITKNSSEKIFYTNLSKFINDGIELSTSANAFHVFVSLFEAVYGFYCEMNPKKD